MMATMEEEAGEDQGFVGYGEEDYRNAEAELSMWERHAKPWAFYNFQQA